MLELNRRLDLVRRLPRALREAALLAAHDHAGEIERDAIVAELLHVEPDRTLTQEAMLSLMRRWKDLSRAARQALLVSVGPALSTLFVRLEHSEDPADRLAAALLACSCLTDPDAGAALTHLTGVLGSAATAEGRSRGVMSVRLDSLIASAAGAYDQHRASALLEMVVRTAHAPGPNLRAWLCDHEQPGHMALRGVARSMPADVRRARCVQWLGVPALSGLACQIIDTAADEGAQRTILEQAFHLVRESRRSAARRVRLPARVLPGTDSLAAMPAESRRGFVRWLEVLTPRHATRLERLVPLASDREPAVRLDAALAISRLSPARESDAVLVRLAQDPSEAVALTAAGALAGAESASRRESLSGEMKRLGAGTHERVGLLAAQAARVFGADLESAGGDRWSCPVGARLEMSRRREHFVHGLRGAIRSAGDERRLLLINAAARLDALVDIEDELIATTASPDLRLASRVAALLSRVRTDRAGEALDRLLAHPAARVRANALESLCIVAPSDERLERFLHSASARLRANALRHRLLTRPGWSSLPLLAEMLGDERPEHRSSALWVAERMGCTALAGRVADMTRRDPDPRVHERAQRCARRLLASLRQGWSESLSATEAA